MNDVRYDYGLSALIKGVDAENKKSALPDDEDDFDAKQTKQKRISSLIKLAVIGVSIAIIITLGTIAWFTSSMENFIGSLTMRSANERGIEVEYEAFRYNSTDESCVKISVFDLNNPNGLLLNEYDTIFTERNENTGILMKIIITGEVEAGNDAILRLDRDSIIHNSSMVYISDISYFQCALNSDCGLEDYDNDLDEMWTHAKTYFGGADSPVKQTFGRYNSLDLKKFTQSDFGRTVVWVYMDYDESLVRDVINDMSFTLNQTIEVKRDCDIIRVITTPKSS